MHDELKSDGSELTMCTIHIASLKKLIMNHNELGSYMDMYYSQAGLTLHSKSASEDACMTTTIPPSFFTSYSYTCNPKEVCAVRINMFHFNRIIMRATSFLHEQIKISIHADCVSDEEKQLTIMHVRPNSTSSHHMRCTILHMPNSVQGRGPCMPVSMPSKCESPIGSSNSHIHSSSANRVGDASHCGSNDIILVNGHQLAHVVSTFDTELFYIIRISLSSNNANTTCVVIDPAGSPQLMVRSEASSVCGEASFQARVKHATRQVDTPLSPRLHKRPTEAKFGQYCLHTLRKVLRTFLLSPKSMLQLDFNRKLSTLNFSFEGPHRATCVFTLAQVHGDPL